MARAKTTTRIRIGAKRQITLPKNLGLKEGDQLEARVLEDRIELIPLVAIPRDQAWFWTPEWQAKEREAEAAASKGDFKDYGSVDDLIAGLNR